MHILYHFEKIKVVIFKFTFKMYIKCYSDKLNQVIANIIQCPKCCTHVNFKFYI